MEQDFYFVHQGLDAFGVGKIIGCDVGRRTLGHQRGIPFMQGKVGRVWDLNTWAWSKDNVNWFGFHIIGLNNNEKQRGQGTDEELRLLIHVSLLHRFYVTFLRIR